MIGVVSFGAVPLEDFLLQILHAPQRINRHEEAEDDCNHDRFVEFVDFVSFYKLVSMPKNVESCGRDVSDDAKAGNRHRVADAAAAQRSKELSRSVYHAAIPMGSCKCSDPR